MEDVLLKSPPSKTSCKSSKMLPMSVLLQGLPVHNVDNFSKFHPDTHKNSSKKSTQYIPTNDDYPSLEIVSEKNNILLRYLHQSWERKCPRRKREAAEPRSTTSDDSNQQNSSQPRSKRPKHDHQTSSAQTLTSSTSSSSASTSSTSRPSGSAGPAS